MAEGTGKDEDEGLSDTARGLRAAQPYINAMWKLVGGAMFGVLGGYFADKAFGTTPWILVGLSAAGIAVGFYAFVRDMLRMGKK